MIIVIDDLRTFRPEYEKEGTLYLRDSKTALEALRVLEARDTYIDEIWLDHDLGGSDTIWPVVEFLETSELVVEGIYIITSNPVGRVRIHTALTKVFTKVVCVYKVSTLFEVNDTPGNPGFADVAEPC